MADREKLIQRYSDLLDAELDGDELQAVALLDAAAAPYRTIEPPASLDHAVERFVRQRRAPALNGASIEPVPSETARYSSSPSRLPTRLRTSWLRQGLGMVAAVLAVALLAGVLAVTFRNQGGGPARRIGRRRDISDSIVSHGRITERTDRHGVMPMRRRGAANVELQPPPAESLLRLQYSPANIP